MQAATPAATPLAGLHDNHQAMVADALAAAVEVSWLPRGTCIISAVASTQLVHKRV